MRSPAAVRHLRATRVPPAYRVCAMRVSPAYHLRIICVSPKYRLRITFSPMSAVRVLPPHA